MQANEKNKICNMRVNKVSFPERETVFHYFSHISTFLFIVELECKYETSSHKSIKIIASE